MQFKEASANDLDAAYAVLLESRLDLEAQGLMQWDPQYPSRSFFGDAISTRSLFTLSDQRRICGVVVLNETQAPEWNAVAWHTQDPPFLVIHALTILPDLQGCGYGKRLLRVCEAFARERGYTSIRLDAFSENSPALNFYEQQGYAFRGQVLFAFKPVGHQRYKCYEKSLTREEQNVRPASPLHQARLACR